MQTYLVIMKDAPEAKVALRFAARRAAKTDRAVEVLAVVEPQEFVQWGGVQAAMEEEERVRLEAQIASLIGQLVEETGTAPKLTVKQGDPIKAIRERIAEGDIAALVLGAAEGANPGPIVKHFTGEGAGDLPCPVLLIPGAMTDEQVESLS
ncbi:universal stress protein [Sphingomicrobium clamense]|uniref:Universal stress protein n=1 Tax=Sphingomicrobium clamense TaxID=2851013 RepID=A0ABS6V4N7_9SPHN|nr:universal stress protein [Sphingomicrobium sp. B8]MBW0144461.1 universal stress protein [Sphingomicrobium sp. B8]